MARHGWLDGPMPLSREQISAIAHTDHPIACPLSDQSVDPLLDRLVLGTGSRVLDLGCGPGEWIRRLHRKRPDCSYLGVDISAPGIAEARRLSADLPLEFRQCDARAFVQGGEGLFDAVLCNGSAHIFGGFAAMLAALGQVLKPAGQVIVSDGFWQSPPSTALCDALGMSAGDLLSLEQVQTIARSAGFRIEHSLVSSEAEWDDYEESWCLALERHAAVGSGLSVAEREQLLDVASTHRSEYRDGYRGIMGYVTMVLRRIQD